MSVGEIGLGEIGFDPQVAADHQGQRYGTGGDILPRLGWLAHDAGQRGAYLGPRQIKPGLLQFSQRDAIAWVALHW